jgi:membrane carboxypeptidase/penicillin-binding protein PbpC
MEIKITLTEAEAKALAYVAADPEDWANNAVHERARIAMEEIFQLEVQRMLADPNTTEIPADREAVVLASTLPSAAERNAIAIENIIPE